MKNGVHPKTYTCKVTCISCGNTFEIIDTKPELRVDTCSKCHPFYTGKQRFVQAAGRVDKFNKKYGFKNEENK